MGFIGSSSTREHAAQEDLEQADADIDFEIEVDYELELAGAAAADESESETGQSDAFPSKHTSDLFELFFCQ